MVCSVSTILCLFALSYTSQHAALSHASHAYCSTSVLRVPRVPRATRRQRWGSSTREHSVCIWGHYYIWAYICLAECLLCVNRFFVLSLVLLPYPSSATLLLPLWPYPYLIPTPMVHRLPFLPLWSSTSHSYPCGPQPSSVRIRSMYWTTTSRSMPSTTWNTRSGPN